MTVIRRRDLLWVAAYAVIWFVCLLLLRGRSPQRIGESIAVFAIFAIAFPVVITILTLGYDRPDVRVHAQREESLLLLGWSVLLAAYFTFLKPFFERGLPGEHGTSYIALFIKLLMFVALPAAGLMLRYGYRLRELFPAKWTLRSLAPALWLGCLFLVLQYIFGQGRTQIRETHLPILYLFFYAVAGMVWLGLEAGLVEEFFFRALLQERLSRYLQSEVAGVVIASIVFGLMHSPGFYLRPAESGEGLGAHPSLLVAVAYSIVTTSAAGVLFGVLWVRTRNLAVVVLCHAAFDLLPNLHNIVRLF